MHLGYNCNMVKKTPPPTVRAVPVTVVILAAGEGKRMKSDLPKVLQPLAGRALLKHVIDTAKSLDPTAIHVVYGHGGDRVRQELEAERVTWNLQAQRLGTGHALAQSMPEILDEQRVLVLYGDVPLIQRATLQELLSLTGPKQVALLTTLLDDPTGYGRVIRDSRGRVQRIVEQKDASKRELKVRECNTGVLAAPARLLKKWLKALRNDNSQGEYYLTDIVAMAVREKLPVNPLVAPTTAEVLGVSLVVAPLPCCASCLLCLPLASGALPRPGDEGGASGRRADAHCPTHGG